MNALVLGGLAPAVQYVRMSTEHQRYSLDNQKMAIAEFAARRGFDIIDTYCDAGKSGLTLKERKALNRLLHDVTDPQRRFSTILVLDISRWGRFQDPDQHGAYEFLCREMGVNVEYVAETFDNDGSPSATLMKNLKRVMAGEYSRELSVKVSQAHYEVARRGYKLGGTIPYGFRRLVLDAEGNPIRLLEHGEHKYLRSDRVVVVPGPDQELRVIHRIFHLFVDERLSIGRIAEILNMERPDDRIRNWTFPRVRYILTSELVIGNYVYGKNSVRLKTPMVRNPEHLWIRTPMLKPIVSKARFEKAQALLNQPRYPFSRTKMIRGLRRLMREKGGLSSNLINACAHLPTYATLRRHFGDIDKLYELLGVDPASKRRVQKRGAKSDFTREEGIAALQAIHKQHGYLSQCLIETTYNAPSTTWYYKTFGSIMKAYEAAGFSFTRGELMVYGNRRSRLHNRVGPPTTPEVTGAWVGSLSDADLFAGMRRIFEENGYISAKLIQQDPRMPPPSWIMKRYASILHAYAMAGLKYTRLELAALSRQQNKKSGAPPRFETRPATFALSAALLPK